MNFNFSDFSYNIFTIPGQYIYYPRTSTGSYNTQGRKYTREPGNNENTRVERGSDLASALSYTDDTMALVGQQCFNVCHQAMPPI